MAGTLCYGSGDISNTQPGVSLFSIEKTWRPFGLRVAVTTWHNDPASQPCGPVLVHNIRSPGLKSDILRGNFPSLRTATSRIIA